MSRCLMAALSMRSVVSLSESLDRMADLMSSLMVSIKEELLMIVA